MEYASVKYCSKSFDFLSPLMKLCTVFGMCPPVFPSKGYRRIDFLWYKFYCAILGVASIAVTGFVMYKKDASISLNSVHVVDNFAHFALTQACVVMIISLVYGHTKGPLFKKMFEAMDSIDDKQKYNINMNKEKMYGAILIYCLLIVVYVIYDAFTWIDLFGSDWYLLYMPKTIQICQFSLGMLLPMCLLSLIYLRFKGFNKSLRQFSKIKLIQAPGFNEPPVDENHKHFIREMCHVHTDLFAMVKSFNKIFGMILLVGTLMAMGLMLNYMAILLVFFQFHLELTGRTKHYVLAQCISGMLIPLLQLIALANIGDRVAFEASKTSNICLALLNKFPAIPTSESEKALIEEVKTLVLQCSFRNIVISAKRFFPVNHTMLAFLMASIVSYIIVLMQFLNENAS